MKGITRFAVVTMLSGTGLTAWGVPAKPGVYTVQQPDGTALRVTKVGDEFCHYLLTEDGKVLYQAESGAYCYARLGADGILESTGTLAVDVDKRAYVPVDAVDIDNPGLRRVTEARRKARSQRPALASADEGGESSYGLGLCTTAFPRTGEPNVLILLVQYSDVEFTLPDPKTYFESMLNEEGFSQYGGTGSCKDYFRENSNGQFVPHFDLYGPVTLPYKRVYYGGNDSSGNDLHPWEMVTHAIEALDDEVDFSRYDNDGDGVIDNVYVIYAGQGEANYGMPYTVWPHSWNIAHLNVVVDGVKVAQYGCSNEWQKDRPDGIGTFVHEFSHVMGLPDLYNTTMNTTYTPSSYSVLDFGPYNNDGCTPPAYSLFERNAMGWSKPEIITGPMNGRLEHVLTSNTGYLVPTNDKNEFFLFENRQQAGWDKYIPGHGMLVWHIDYNRTRWDANTVNNDQYHQCVDIEEAFGRTGSTDYLLGTYPFPGTRSITSFTDDTTPSMKTWAGEGLGLPVTDIEENDGVITFKVAGGDTSVVALEGDETCVEYYDMLGRKVAAPVAGDIVIERKGTEARKVVIR